MARPRRALRRHAPIGQRLTKIFFVLVNFEFGSPIDDAANPNGGIDAHARHSFSWPRLISTAPSC